MKKALLNLWRDGEAHSVEDAKAYGRRIWGAAYDEGRVYSEISEAIRGSELMPEKPLRLPLLLRASPLLLPFRRRFNRSYRLQAAVDWLEWKLKGPMPAATVTQLARTEGIRATTLKVAKSYLGVRSVKRGGQFGGDPRWWWMPAGEIAANDSRDAEEAGI